MLGGIIELVNRGCANICGITAFPASIYLLKVKNETTPKQCVKYDREQAVCAKCLDVERLHIKCL